LKNGSTRKFAILIDDYDSFCDAVRLSPELNTLTLLRDLLRTYGGDRLFLWVAAYLDRSTDVLSKYLLMRRTGFALVVKDSLTRLNVRSTGLSGEIMPPGRAYIPSERGSTIGIEQTALVSDAVGMVQSINEHWQNDQPIEPSELQIAPPARQNHIPRPLENESASPDPIADIDVEGLIEDLLGSVSESRSLPEKRI
jgi:hypothetical protein